MSHDLPANSERKPASVVLKEVPTNVCEIVSETVALVTALARQRGLELCAKIDPKVVEPVLADSNRLRQLLMYLLIYVIRFATRNEVVLIVAVGRSDTASQCLSFVSTEGGRATVQSESSSLPASAEMQPDFLVPFCQLLAERMKGQVTLENRLHQPVRAIFTASFALGKSSSPGAQIQPEIEQRVVEPVERRYLEALSEEGVDLKKFFVEWCRAMNEDLQRLESLRHESDPKQLRKLLHRLSGAVGLVGAQSLTDALRRASMSSQHRNTECISVLAGRIRNLLAQLELAAEPYRSL